MAGRLFLIPTQSCLGEFLRREGRLRNVRMHFYFKIGVRDMPLRDFFLRGFLRVADCCGAVKCFGAAVNGRASYF